MIKLFNILSEIKLVSNETLKKALSFKIGDKVVYDDVKISHAPKIKGYVVNINYLTEKFFLTKDMKDMVHIGIRVNKNPQNEFSGEWIIAYIKEPLKSGKNYEFNTLQKVEKIDEIKLISSNDTFKRALSFKKGDKVKYENFGKKRKGTILAVNTLSKDFLYIKNMAEVIHIAFKIGSPNDLFKGDWVIAYIRQPLNAHDNKQFNTLQKVEKIDEIKLIPQKGNEILKKALSLKVGDKIKYENYSNEVKKGIIEKIKYYDRANDPIDNPTKADAIHFYVRSDRGHRFIIFANTDFPEESQLNDKFNTIEKIY